ncbi:MAG: hypothetical protein QOG68_1089 [Solirubrobacteraceae bacterium]|nr:hypothetical protein [Solirubrobacteraceae bacterium]
MPTLSRLAGLLCTVFLIAGCGGGDKPKSKGYSAPTLASKKTLVRGYGASDTSAGDVKKSYVPTGKILADSNLRPWDDGFNFENYGNDAGPVNMTPAQVEDLFGKQVCYDGTGQSCKLTPAAKQWMDVTNDAMAGGHCMGFSVTALRFFTKNINPSDYGAAKTSALPIVGNNSLQELIAEDWAYQKLPLVTDKQITGAPSDVLKAITTALGDPKKETYTLGILNKTGGHAITPFAVEDQGGGKQNVLVYDNNFPGVVRTVAFDTNQNHWSYHGGPNPSDLNELYEGDAQNPNIVLLPTTPGTQLQPCPFCNGSTAAPRGYGTGTALGKSEQYDEITLTGNPVNHAHLLLTDKKGNRTGFVNGTIINEIPGAEVNRSLTVQNWREAPEPAYRIPNGIAVEVTVDATALDKPDTEDLTLIGPGDYFDISGINLKPGQQDTVSFQSGGGGLNYATNADLTKAPLISGGVVHGSGADQAVYFFNASAVGVKGLSSLAFIFDQKDGYFGIDTGGTTGDLAGSGKGLYVLQLIRGTDTTFDTWSNSQLFLKGGKGETAIVDYLNAPKDRTKPVDVLIDPNNSDPNRHEQLKPDN